MTFPRVRVDELMDDPGLDPERHRQALAGLRRLNTVSRVSSVLFARLSRLARSTPDRPLRVLDVASGSGDLPIDWLRRARRQGIKLSVTALDQSAVAMQTADQAAKRAGVTLGTVVQDCLSKPLPDGFDVVTCSLFMHHLDPPDVSRLIQAMWQASRRAIVICDLERSRLNLGLVSASARLVTRSDIVHFDAAASVRASYTRPEFASLLERSLGFSVPIQASFPCRFLVVIDREGRIESPAVAMPVAAGTVA